jgi:1-acyl-sn-glycerol-3-phosphate acyltransferase
MYATSMKDRILAAAKTKARELQEAARPGTAARELEEALDAGDDEPRVSQADRVEDAAADVDETTGRDLRPGEQDEGGDQRAAS